MRLIYNKSKLKYLILTFVWFAGLSKINAQQIELKGKVVDEQNNALSFAAINFIDIDKTVYSNADGIFTINLNNRSKSTSFTIKITFVGKKSLETNISVNQQTIPVFKLQTLTLLLKDVEFNQKRKTLNSNSSIVFDRQAIEQSQAFSITDILNNLPGKRMVAPNLHSPQNLTLRAEVSGLQALNNSLGIAIVVDDIQLSNNANMQNRNLGRWGLGNGNISSASYGSFDTPFGGLDLRDIPADNIESIEVISGVAPAKYGDLTDGAIIINRQAGRTPYQFNTRINAGSTNYTLSKGYKLKHNLGALNLGLNYLKSNEDPSDKTKVYDRISTNLIWTANLKPQLKNTFSVDFSTKIDDVKLDPDDGLELKTFSKARNFSFSNRATLSIKESIVESINFNVSYSKGYQESYNQRYLNGSPKGISDKDVSGEIYEGYFIPGTYLAAEHIIGKPNNLNAGLSLNSQFFTGKVRHNFSVGSNMYYSKNNGEGIIVDPTKPRWANSAYQNERPYSYESLPDVINYGIFLQDNTKLTIDNRPLNLNVGLRLDVQNAKTSIQPRINAAYALKKDLNLTLAYGRSTKSPTLAHRFPAPNYIDLILLNQFTGNVNESIFLVYTDKIVADNSQLKPSESQQAEMGFQFKNKGLNSSIVVYWKDNKNGFSNNTVYHTYNLPNYSFTYVPNNRPIIAPTGTYKKQYVGVSTVGNDLNSKNWGLEWGVNSNKIEAIKTSFSINTSFSYSKYKNNAERIVPTSQENIDAGKPAWFGIYPANEYEALNIMSKVAATTHIPKIGFVVNLLADVYWQDINKTLADSYKPIAYLDKDMNRFNISNFNVSDPTYGYLNLTTAANSETKLPFVYANLGVRISKEIKEKIRLSVNAYNFLNLQYRHFNPNTNQVTTYSYPTSVGAEISIKF